MPKSSVSAPRQGRSRGADARWLGRKSGHWGRVKAPVASREVLKDPPQAEPVRGSGHSLGADPEDARKSVDLQAPMAVGELLPVAGCGSEPPRPSRRFAYSAAHLLGRPTGSHQVLLLAQAERIAARQRVGRRVEQGGIPAWDDVSGS